MITNGNLTSGMVRVLIVDDHPVIQRSLASMLGEDQSLQLIGQAMSGVEALEMLRVCQPEVIIMDYSMPGMDGIETTQIISHQYPHIHIIAYSSTDTIAVVDAMYKAGAERFCRKGDSSLDLLNAIHQVVSQPA